MRKLTHPARRRLARLLGTGVLLAGGIGTAALTAAGPASAATCSGAPVAAGTTCTVTGTLTLTGGTLTMTSPTALAWAGTVTGTDLNLVDTTTAQQAYLISDATGSGAGWHVTISATKFITGAGGLPNTGTFSTNGSITSMTAATAPTATCSSGSTCTLPTNTTTYPVAITTAPTAPATFTIYDTAVNTGLGSIAVGLPGANPVGWWLNVPANSAPGTYTSTITLGVVTAP
jgi:hypothetical protein